MPVPTGTTRPTCQFDVVDRSFYQDPHPAYTWMREHRPVFWDEAHELWVLTRHADVQYVSTHAELFCSGQGIRPTQSVDLSLVGLDGERHLRQRRLLNQGFSPRIIRAMEPRVRAVVTEVLDRIADRASCDFVTDIAVPVPLVVIAELMGLPTEDRVRLGHWSDRMMSGEGRSDPDDPVMADAAAAFGEYVGYLTSMVEERRQAYRKGRSVPDDVISVLVGADEDGVLESNEELTHDELTMFLVVLLVAGNETTRNAISGGMWALNSFPDQWERLRSTPESFATMADEVCRFVSPVISFARTATQDTELRGHPIGAGEKVLMLYQSANRDEDVFDDPGVLRVDRSPNPHLAFGVGPHVCMGLNLARLEIRVLFEELTKRFPDMVVAPGARPVYVEHALVHAIDSLPVEYSTERS
ncbi:MAG TPA: cytochrome P450 [Acidimicrobiales bacterium]|nr:cytochrome P450 [Acidimicrobiales bacterium]